MTKTTQEKIDQFIEVHNSHCLSKEKRFLYINMTPDDKIRQFKRVNRKNPDKPMYWKNWQEVKEHCEKMMDYELKTNDDGSFTFMGVKHYKGVVS